MTYFGELPGVSELLIILSILLLIFGARRLPELARSVGQSARELRKGMSDNVSEVASDGEKTSGKTE